MARYIDVDALIEELKSLSITVTGLISGKCYLSEIVKEYKNSILRIIDEQPTADVVPRSEVERLQSRVNRLKRYDEERDIALHARLIAETKEKVARAIFKDLREMVIPEKCTDGCAFYLDMVELTELEKKYEIHGG